MSSTQKVTTLATESPNFGGSDLLQTTIVENIAIDKHDVASAWLPTKYGKFRMHVFRNLEGEEADSVVLIYGEIKPEDVPLVRLHSECMTGDVFGSRKCDCGEQLNAALAMIVKEKAGILIYSRQEGRGIGLFNKIRAYELQDQGRDTIQANEELGLPVDGRTYQPAASMLKYLKVTKIRLITNNPAKAESLRALQIDVVSTVPNVIPPHPENKDYLKIKELKMRHSFKAPVIPPKQGESKHDEVKQGELVLERCSGSSSPLLTAAPDSPLPLPVPVPMPSSSSTAQAVLVTPPLPPTEPAGSSSGSSSSSGRSCKKRCSSDLDCYGGEAVKIQAI